MSLPTLSELLELPAFHSVAHGVEVLSGVEALEEAVSWVHVSEVLDAARFLSGGELLLSTGVALARATPEERIEFVRSLEEAGAVGLALELVQSFSEVPREMLEEARRLEFPLLVFKTEVKFAELSRAAIERILASDKSEPPQATLEGVLEALERSGQAERFIAENLGPLLRLKARPQRILLATLEAILRTQFNMAEAARRLSIRRQTIYYRLEQLRAYLGADFGALERQIVLLLALELMGRKAKESEILAEQKI